MNATKCVACAARTLDHDDDATTPCVGCPTGSASGRGQTECSAVTILTFPADIKSFKSMSNQAQLAVQNQVRHWGGKSTRHPVLLYQNTQ